MGSTSSPGERGGQGQRLVRALVRGVQFQHDGVLLVRPEVVHRRVDEDAPQPGAEGEGRVVLVEVGENLEEGIVHYFLRFLPVSGVAQAHAHAIAKEVLEQPALTVPVALPAAFEASAL